MNSTSLWSQLNYGTASILEIVWTAVGLIGLVTIIILLREALLDLRAVKSDASLQRRSQEHIIAHQNVRRMIQKVFCFIFFVAIGIIAMVTPPGRTSATGPTLYAAVLSAGLVMTEVLLTLSAIQDRRDRLAVIMLSRLRRKEDEDASGVQRPAAVPGRPG